MNALEFLVENIPWIFSGIGVSFLVAFNNKKRNNKESVEESLDVQISCNKNNISVSKHKTVIVAKENEK